MVVYAGVIDILHGGRSYVGPRQDCLSGGDYARTRHV